MPTINELDFELNRLREGYKSRYDSFPTKTLADGTEAKDIPAEAVKELRDLQADMEAKGNLLNDLRNAERVALEAAEGLKAGGTPVNRVALPAQAKAVDILTAARSMEGYEADYESTKNWLRGLGMKATMTTSAGYAPEVLRTGDVVPAISRPPQLIDFLPMVQTTQNSIKFMAQTTRTNAAAPKAEVTAVDEATIVYTEQTDTIEKIGVFLPVSDVQLEDEPMARSMVDNDLVLMVRQVLDEQVTVGSGTPPALRGLYNATNIQTQAKGADVTMDAIHKAITLIRVTGRAQAGVIALHSNDWQEIRLTRTADGIYILGNPNDAGAQQLWGLPVVLTEALTEGNGLVFDPAYVRLVMRTGVNIAISDSHASNFIASVQTIRATVRAGLLKLRGQAACRVTGI